MTIAATQIVSLFRMSERTEAWSSAARRAPRSWDWYALRAAALQETRRYLDRQAAEDAAQEALLRAWRHARACSTSDPTLWVTAIARREALRAAARRTSEPPDENSVQDAIVDDETDHTLRRVDIRRALLQLSVSDRGALLLYYWADLSHQQIARGCAVSTGTIRLRVFRARQKLSLVLLRDTATSSPERDVCRIGVSSLRAGHRSRPPIAG